ncbi:MAG: shikimate kinase [Deltaproteobacteria bacterium]|nr:shikimate kinase [Deltaproteobacteria bacterium]
MPKPIAFAVAGAPVLHSASPRLFRAAFAGAGMDAAYTRLSVSSAQEAVRLARAIGLRGLNVTAPFKEDMARLCDSLDAAAAAVGAVNTVLVDELGLRGFNTDGEGTVGALRAAGIEPTGKTVVVLSAGGAAKAAAYALVNAGAARVTILARDAAKARAAAAATGSDAGPLNEAARRIQGADILVSCLPPHASRAASDCLRPGLGVLDANYHAPGLSLEATARGCVVARGGDWLVRQAERAFGIFMGIEAPAGAMAAAFDKPFPAFAGPALVGFSGSGKSAVGPLLAALLGMELRDTDALAEAATGATVREIFEQRGEAEFRCLERKAVARAVGGKAVVALGGGALLDAETLALVTSTCLTVWLWADPGIAGRRAAGGSRPLLDHGANATALLEERMPGYLRAAELVVATDGDAPEAVAKRIEDEVRRAFTG